jgi:hypothetical protein
VAPTQVRALGGDPNRRIEANKLTSGKPLGANLLLATNASAPHSPVDGPLVTLVTMAKNLAATAGTRSAWLAQAPLLTLLLTARVSNFHQMWQPLQVSDLMAVLVPRGGIEPPTP